MYIPTKPFIHLVHKISVVKEESWLRLARNQRANWKAFGFWPLCQVRPGFLGRFNLWNCCEASERLFAQLRPSALPSSASCSCLWPTWHELQCWESAFRKWFIYHIIWTSCPSVLPDFCFCCERTVFYFYFIYLRRGLIVAKASLDLPWLSLALNL